MLGVASTAFDVAPVLIKAPFLRPGLTVGDAIEVVGVFVFLALFLRSNRIAGTGRRGLAAAALAGAAFALGHGIHVAANSIHDLSSRNGVGDPTGLIDFWDEHVGHYLIDAARVLFSATLLGSKGSPDGSGSRGDLALALVGGAAYGFTTFASSVEGQTVPLVLPFYLLVAVWLAASRRRFAATAESRTIGRFFTGAAATALLLFLIWGIWQHGFPEFTSAGLIPGGS
jgi:hypothetical protein